jgi:hypothetical protein
MSDPAPLSETRGADELTSPCDENIRPIFPVRYALSEDALFNVARDGASPGEPGTVSAQGQYELRRLRQGYVYIFARNGHPDKLSSDSDGTWLVFGYVSQGQDDSSSDIRSDTDIPQGRYQFYKMSWVDGGADGRWEVTDKRRYPYAFVNKQVSEIEIAYSEERWPGHLLTMAQVDASLRARLMTKVNVVAETTEQSAPLAQLADHVAEFKRDAKANPAGNAVRYTAFQPEAVTNVVQCTNSRENGRLIAVKDHLGELMDIQAAHEAKSQSLRTFSAEYQYPLLIGPGVENLKSHIDLDGGWFNKPPLDPNFETTLAELRAEQKSLEDELRALVKAYWQIAGRRSHCALLDEADVVLRGLDEVKSDDTKARRADYAFFVLSRVFQTLGTSSHGSASMTVAFEGTATDRSKDWGVIFSRVVNAMATASPQLMSKYRTHMNVTFAVTSKELAMSWVRRESGLVTREAVERILGVRSFIRPVNPNTMEDALKGVFASVGLTGQRPRAFDSTGLTAVFDGGGFRPDQMVGVPFFEINGTGTLTAQGESFSNAYRAADLADKGGSMVLGLYAAFVAVRNWDVISPSITEMGAIAQDPKVQVASALLDTMAGLNALRGVPNAAVYTQKIGQQVFDRLFKAGSGRFFGAHIAAAQAQTAAQGVSRNLLSYLTLGNLAGAVGIALAGMQAFEGFKADDLAKGYGNTLIAVGGLVVLIFGLTGLGAVIGGLLIIAGTVMTFFGDDAPTYWARHSFWGSSEKYWGGEQRDGTVQRMEEAKKISSGDRFFLDAFEQELNAYRDLTGSLRIENATSGDLRFEIHCPSIKSIADLPRLSATVRFIAPSLGIGGGGFSGPVVPASRHFIRPGLVHLQLSEKPGREGDRISDLRVEASYPKLNGGEYSDSLSIKVRNL